MVTIMLVCNAGMSTSMIVKKMQAAAKEKNIDADIFSVSAPEVDQTLSNKNVDVVLFGPQVRFMVSRFEKKLNEKNIPYDLIDSKDYGLMKGEKILDQALGLADKK